MAHDRSPSSRTMLRAFQQLHKGGLDPGFMADVELLRHKDLDLSVKLGAVLAFDALIIGAGVLPISSSPGAPLSVDAAHDPVIVLLALVGVALLGASAYFCVRGVMIGEAFDDSGLGDDQRAIAQRLFAAYCAAIDTQARLLGIAARLTIAGGGLAAAALVWALVDKWAG
ncbi:MAG: hypothetical protein NW200_00760 [Hyphomonadaceae bacterium]|nr:hypothetical protein [Hyphomonadaceae bacterium]